LSFSGIACREEGWREENVRRLSGSECSQHQEQASITCIEDLFDQLQGACVFSKIDLLRVISN
jgi:hypothetical protein